MKKFKGILLALLSVVCVGAMAVGFAGCGDSEDENSSSKQKPIFSQSSSSEVSSIVNGSSVKESSSSVGESSSSVEVNSSSSVEFNSSIEENSSAVINSSSNVEDSSSVENSTSSMEDSSSILDSSSNNGSSSSDSSSSNNGCAHEWESITIKEATCTEKGLATDVCLLCGDDYSRIISALGHDYVDHDAQEQTCTAIGWEAYQTCDRVGCDYNTYQELPALGHDYVDHAAKAATCTEIGWNAYQTCNRTGCDYTTYREIGLQDHHEYSAENICVDCGERKISKGLKYELNADGASYSVTGIGACTDTELIIPEEYNDLPVTAIGSSAFYNCSSLTSVVIGDSVTTIGKEAFYNTGYYNDESNWKNDVLYIGKHLIKARDSISGEYTIKEGTLCIADNAFTECSSLTSVVIGDSVTSIGNSAFYNCSSLKSVEIPNSVSTIGGGAFNYCTSLTSIKIPDTVTTIGDYAFNNTGYYNDESNWKNDVLYIGKHLIKARYSINGEYTIKDGTLCIADEAFFDCYNLTNVTIPDSVTTIGSNAFAICYGLTSIEVAENNIAYKSIDGNLYTKDRTTLIRYAIGKTAAEFIIPDSVTTIGEYAFRNCSSLTSVEIPDSVTTIGNGAFYYCSSLTSIEIPNSVTTIGEWAFLYCESLTSIEIPDGVTTIGDYAFWYCSSLTSIEIPDSVTTIGDYAFRGCSSLTSIEIPDSVTTIGDYAFNDCNSLTSITFNGTVEEWNAISKGSSWKYKVPATEVVCKDGSVAL